MCVCVCVCEREREREQRHPNSVESQLHSLVILQDGLIRHVLFHSYYAYLKHQGTVYQKKYQLPPCHLGQEEEEMMDEEEVEEMVCMWREGDSECGREFDCTLEFHRHVHEHVTSQRELKCCWGGMCVSLCLSVCLSVSVCLSFCLSVCH